MDEERREYFIRRASTGCSGCGALDQTIDPISALCSRCKSSLLIHGSPTIPKPKLKQEIEVAEMRVAYACKLERAEQTFNSFMNWFASPSKSDPLKRLCYLHFIKLRSSDGEPLMRFRDSIVQAYALTIFDENGGRFDARKRQFNYCIGRASICPWNKRRFSAIGTDYDYSERRGLQRKPTLMHRAFQEIFIEAGISRLISKIKHKIKEE